MAGIRERLYNTMVSNCHCCMSPSFCSIYIVTYRHYRIHFTHLCMCMEFNPLHSLVIIHAFYTSVCSWFNALYIWNCNLFAEFIINWRAFKLNKLAFFNIVTYSFCFIFWNKYFSLYCVCKISYIKHIDNLFIFNITFICRNYLPFNYRFTSTLLYISNFNKCAFTAFPIKTFFISRSPAKAVFLVPVFCPGGSIVVFIFGIILFNIILFNIFVFKTIIFIKHFACKACPSHICIITVFPIINVICHTNRFVHKIITNAFIKTFARNSRFCKGIFYSTAFIIYFCNSICASCRELVHRNRFCIFNIYRYFK